MITYRIVKYCRSCRKRYLVNKGESKKNYCDDCHDKVQKYYAEKDKKEAKKAADKEKEDKKKRKKQRKRTKNHSL